MFEKITPEEAGISSSAIEQYISALERQGLAMHSVLMMKGEQLFAEYYWKPFDKDFCHRMYSQTKSYVSIAIGLLEEDGLLSLDDTIVSHFPEKLDGEPHPYLAEQTIREMLTMETSQTLWNWFKHGDPDRVHYYMNGGTNRRPSGTVWEYDSTGTQVLSALVEKLSGKSLFDFLNERILSKLGTFQTAQILKTGNGDSWGDSALLCTPRDMLSFARFVMNYGTFHGERLMNEAYLRKATSAVVDNDEDGWCEIFEHGYGYKIWHCEDDAFAFVGMGGQLTLCFPKKDLIVVFTGDNQGYDAAYQLILRLLYELVVYPMKDEPLPENKEAEESLTRRTKDLCLIAARGRRTTPLAECISGKEYRCEENPMGITRFALHFTPNGGELYYTNAQGDKVLPFGMCENLITKFPEYGYSDDIGGQRTTNGFLYRAAVSAAWREESKLMIRVQIIDRYFGNATMIFAFKGKDAVVRMKKTAEDFLDTYAGMLVAHLD